MQQIKIHEVGLRDGLQMEKQPVDTSRKLEWIELLIAANVDVIQVGSFVHPKRVPQMADTDELFSMLGSNKTEHVKFSGLVLNEKGLERGLACGVDIFCMGVSASETHSRKNTGMGTAEAQQRIVSMANTALSEGKEVQVSVQSAFGCGYEGKIPDDLVIRLVAAYLDAGLTKISLADTAGHADPDKTTGLFSRIQDLDETTECTCHFHNTYGMGLANCIAALDSGVSSFESAFGGLGGCPFTAVAGGNVCTEDLVHMFQRMGMCTDVKLERLIQIAHVVAEFLGRDLPGSVYKCGPIPDRIGDN
jgi:hydroxymethylglutaryl-CoA lyase